MGRWMLIIEKKPEKALAHPSDIVRISEKNQCFKHCQTFLYENSICQKIRVPIKIAHEIVVLSNDPRMWKIWYPQDIRRPPPLSNIYKTMYLPNHFFVLIVVVHLMQRIFGTLLVCVLLFMPSPLNGLLVALVPDIHTITFATLWSTMRSLFWI